MPFQKVHRSKNASPSILVFDLFSKLLINFHSLFRIEHFYWYIFKDTNILSMGNFDYHTHNIIFTIEL